MTARKGSSRGWQLIFLLIVDGEPKMDGHESCQD